MLRRWPSWIEMLFQLEEHQADEGIALELHGVARGILSQESTLLAEHHRILTQLVEILSR
jgi:hypothetical protein